MRENLKFNRKLVKKLDKDFGVSEYPHYYNYDAIEVPLTEAIPSDYEGSIGVPITFMDKHNPDQFEIVGYSYDLGIRDEELKAFDPRGGNSFYVRLPDGGFKRTFNRIVIRRKKGGND